MSLNEPPRSSVLLYRAQHRRSGPFFWGHPEVIDRPDCAGGFKVDVCDVRRIHHRAATTMPSVEACVPFRVMMEEELILAGDSVVLCLAIFTKHNFTGDNGKFSFLRREKLS